VIAVAAALLLFSASLDDVPDYPELLNPRSGPSVSLQVVHHDVATRFQIHIAGELPQPRATGAPHVPVLSLAVSSSPPRSLYHAADPSPPAALS
jgi:hypothetical protein